MVTGFVNEEKEKARDFSDDDKVKPKNEKQLRCRVSYYESVMLPNLDALPFIERGMEKEDMNTKGHIELECEEKFLNFAVLPFAAAENSEKRPSLLRQGRLRWRLSLLPESRLEKSLSWPTMLRRLLER